MSDQDKSERGNRPVETLRDGALKLAIFRNQDEHGASYAMVPGRIYTDKESGKVRETHSLAGGEALRMAHLLTCGYQRVQFLREHGKNIERASKSERDQERER